MEGNNFSVCNCKYALVTYNHRASLKRGFENGSRYQYQIIKTSVAVHPVFELLVSSGLFIKMSN